MVVKTLPTVGEIAKSTGYAIHRVEYVIRSRQILPYAFAGNSRVFTEADVKHINSELHAIDAGRGDGQ